MRLVRSYLPWALAAALAPSAAAAADWEKVTETEGVDIYAREVEGSDVKEMKAYGGIDASPERVLAVLADVGAYKETMPYTELSKQVKREGNTVWLYTVINAPLVDRRDYGIQIKLSRKSDGTLRSEWIPANQIAPPENPDVVRVKINDGYWLLTPVDGGKKTKAVYYVHTDPGGSVPKWIVNKANSQAVPDVFLAIRKAVASPRYANVKSPLVEDSAPAPEGAASPAAAAGPGAAAAPGK